MAEAGAAVAAGGVNMVLVTGASGYVAAHVTQQLLRAGYRVRGTVRSLENKAKVEPLRNLCPDAKHQLELVEADLLKPDSWKAAVEGCSHVIHIASPFPSERPRDEKEVIEPAVQGTTSILKACQEVGNVKRVVLTSSIVAVSGTGMEPNHVYSEADWPDLAAIGPYEKSKTLAEKAAWDFIENLKEEEKFELAVVNPGFVMGPMLSGSTCTSMEVPKKLLMREIPLLPKLNFGFVDVRDVAAAHIKAMTVPEAAGNRHVLVGGNLWFREVALILEREFKSQGYSIPTLVAPKIGVQFFSLFDSSIKLILPFIGKITLYNNTRMTKVLGIQPYSLEDTLVDMAYSIIERGFVPKKAKYRGPKKVDKEAAVEESNKGMEAAAVSPPAPSVDSAATTSANAANDTPGKSVTSEPVEAAEAKKEAPVQENKTKEDKNQDGPVPAADDVPGTGKSDPAEAAETEQETPAQDNTKEDKNQDESAPAQEEHKD
ncbi:uncharacterized protein [Ptychodera flava]|uniref:uncharacterized protein isoform X2 n=1 Tax=Ptychodera flava TaxID=63121 RepID=UPI00396A0B9A